MTNNKIIGGKQFEDGLRKIWEKANGKFAKLAENNVFTGDLNTFKDIKFEDKTLHNESFVGGRTAGGSKKTGMRTLDSHSNDNNGYVKKIFVRVGDHAQENSKVEVSVWEVEKGSDKSKDKVLGKIKDYESCTVKTGGSWTKHIEIPIEKKYDKPTYFIYQVFPSEWLVYADTDSGEAIYLGDNYDVTSGNITANTTPGHVGIHYITGGGIDVRGSLENCAKEHTDNNFTSKNTFTDGYVRFGVNNTVSKIVNDNATTSTMSDTQYFATKNIYANKDDYVEKLVIKVVDTKTTNETVDGLKVFVIDFNNNMTLEEIPVNSNLNILSYSDGDLGNTTKVVEVPIGKFFNTKVTFGIVGGNGCVAWGTNNTGVSTSSGNGSPQVNSVLGSWSTNNTSKLIGTVKVVSKDIPLKELANKAGNAVLHSETTNVGGNADEHGGKVVKLDTNGLIDRTMLPAGIGGQGTVTSVNGIQGTAVNGEVIIDASEIKVDRTGVDTTTIKDALNNKLDKANLVDRDVDAVGQTDRVPRLNAQGKLDSSFIPEIAINRVLTATDKNDAIGKIGDTDTHLQVGDVVVLNDGTVHMYKGTPPADEGTFETGFLKISHGNGTITTINGQTSQDGSMTLDLKINEGNNSIDFVTDTDEKKSLDLYADGDATTLLGSLTLD